jgi:hypothetical protein
MESAAGVSWSMTKQFCGYTDEDASAFLAGAYLSRRDGLRPSHDRSPRRTTPASFDCWLRPFGRVYAFQIIAISGATIDFSKCAILNSDSFEGYSI